MAAPSFVDLLRPDGEPERARLAPGLRFRHARLLDTAWKPGPGQRYSDAPPAVCVVTAVRQGRVYFAQDGSSRGSLYTTVERFLAAGHLAAANAKEEK